MKILNLVLLLVCLATVASAETKPLFSKDRASLAAGVDYSFYNKAGVEPVPSFKKEFEAGLFGAYNLTPQLSLTASAGYGFDNKFVRYKVGLRTVIWRGK